MTSIQVNIKGINVTLTYEQAIKLNAELESKIYATPEHKNENEGIRNKIQAIVIGHDLPAAQEIVQILTKDFVIAHTMLDFPLLSVHSLEEKLVKIPDTKFDWDKMLPMIELKNQPTLENNGGIPWNPRPSKKKR